MTPISGVNTGTVRPLTAPERVSGAQKTQQPEEEAQSRQAKPVMDEYVPERAADAPQGSENKGDVKEVCDTGKVDREIEKLKKKQAELAQQLNTETDEAKIKDLERQLAQVERELKQKDNDTYRRQHATFTKLA